MIRSGRFYRRNEKEVMQTLGMKPTPNSGSGWVNKEDGESEHLLAQLKSTDKQSMVLHKLDFDKLLSNSATAHKLPVFVVQWLSDGQVYLMVRPQDLDVVAAELCGTMDEEDGERVIHRHVKSMSELPVSVAQSPSTQQAIVSAANAREEFNRQQESARDKTKYIGGRKDGNS